MISKRTSAAGLGPDLAARMPPATSGPSSAPIRVDAHRPAERVVRRRLRRLLLRYAGAMISAIVVVARLAAQGSGGTAPPSRVTLPAGSDTNDAKSYLSYARPRLM